MEESYPMGLALKDQCGDVAQYAKTEDDFQKYV